jgi:hypothetical protein
MHLYLNERKYYFFKVINYLEITKAELKISKTLSAPVKSASVEALLVSVEAL